MAIRGALWRKKTMLKFALLYENDIQFSFLFYLPFFIFVKIFKYGTVSFPVCGIYF